MQPHRHIEIPRACSVSVFSSGGAVPSSGWLTWEKPAGTSMIYLWALGGGGGGGGGQSSPAGTARGGGGGGQSSATQVMLYPAIALPDVLYIMIGKGGAGGVADRDGEEGQVTTISIDPQTDLYSWVNLSGTCNPSSGKAGYRGSGGAGGQERDTQFDDANSSWWTRTLSAGRRDDYGYPNFANRGTAGGSSQVGGTGGYGGGEMIVCGGAGGGGVSSSNVAYAGGAITGRGVIPGLSAGAAGGGNGSDGWNNLCAEVPSNTTLMYSSGGSGGGGSTTTGGKGGKGGFGSGGGGGGAGVTGGAGGDGGDGVAILIAW